MSKQSDKSKSNRGVKRKWEELTEDNLGTRISGKLHHDLKAVRKVAKKAKACEVQRLAKKLKSLRKKGENPNEINELEAQLEISKHTDHEPIANTAFKTKLNKDRMLSENIHIRASISKELDSNLLVLAIAGTPEAKVQSRLLSSKTLATQVAVAVEDLKAVIQPDRRDGLQREAEDVDDSNADIPERHEKAKTATRAELDDEGMDNVAEGKCDDSFEDEGGGLETKADDAGWESVAIGSEDGAEDGWESGSISDERAKEHSKLTSEGDSDDDDSDQNPQVEHAKAKRRISAIAKATPKVTGTTSTFLPSLSVGFTRGDSDGSEFSDGEAVESYQKKNRRGQRARRAIWEKKYGKNANHRKVGLEAAKASCRGPRPDRDGPQNRVILNKTTPVPDHRVRHKDIPRHQPDTGWGQRTGTSPENMTSHTAAPPHRPQRPQLASRGEEQLHPSWEAKRKLKEKQNAGILPSQGTKIKFE